MENLNCGAVKNNTGPSKVKRCGLYGRLFETKVDTVPGEVLCHKRPWMREF